MRNDTLVDKNVVYCTPGSKRMAPDVAMVDQELPRWLVSGCARERAHRKVLSPRNGYQFATIRFRWRGRFAKRRSIWSWTGHTKEDREIWKRVGGRGVSSVCGLPLVPVTDSADNKFYPIDANIPFKYGTFMINWSTVSIALAIEYTQRYLCSE